MPLKYLWVVVKGSATHCSVSLYLNCIFPIFCAFTSDGRKYQQVFCVTRGYTQHSYTIPAIRANCTNSASVWHLWIMYELYIATGPWQPPDQQHQPWALPAAPCITSLHWTALSAHSWQPLPTWLHHCDHEEEGGWKKTTVAMERLESSHTLLQFLSQAGRTSCLPRKVLVQNKMSVGSVAAPDEWEWEGEAKGVPNCKVGGRVKEERTAPEKKPLSLRRRGALWADP